MIMTYAEIICAAIISLGMPNADFACTHMDTVVEVSEEYNLDPIMLPKNRIFNARRTKMRYS